MQSMTEAAKAAGVAPWRVRYAIENGSIPAPATCAGRRCFLPADIARIKRHFAAVTRRRRVQ